MPFSYNKIITSIILIVFFLSCAQATILANLTRDWSNAQGRGTATNAGWIFYRYFSTGGGPTDMTWDATNQKWIGTGVSRLENQTIAGYSYFPGSIETASDIGSSPGWVYNANQSYANAYISFREWGYATGGDGINLTVKHNSTTIGNLFIASGQNVSGFLYVPNLAKGANISIYLDPGANSGSDSAISYDWIISDSLNDSNGIFINAFDELIPTAAKQFNVTISNSTLAATYQVNYGSNPGFNKSLSEVGLPNGELTITIKNASCLTTGALPRQFTWNTANGGMNTTSYLLCDGSSPLFVRANVWTQTQTPLANVSITVQKQIGSGYPTISSGLTTGNGVFPVYLQTNDVYIYTFSKLGYQPLTLSIVAAQNDFYVVMLLNSTTTLQTIFSGIGRTIRPSILELPNSTAAMVEYNITTDVNSTISWFSMNLSYSNGTTAFFYNNTSPTGGNITAFIDTSKENSYIRGDFNFSRVGYGQYNETYFFKIMQLNTSTINSSFSGFVQYLSNSSGGRFVKATIALGVVFIIAATIAPFSTTAAGFAALLTLAYFITQPNIIVLSTDKNGFGTASPQTAMLIFISLVVVALTVRKSGY